MREIGSIDAILRYPIKSMAGERLHDAQLTRGGVVGDRVLALRRSGFLAPGWLTARHLPKLVLYRTSFSAERSSIVVTMPDGSVGTLNSDDFAHRLAIDLGVEFMIRSGSPQHDVAPVSLISHREIRSVEDSIGVTLDPRRFRANFLVNWTDGFDERELIGGRLRIGSDVVITVTEPIRRCKIINIDPTTASIDPRILATVAKKNGRQLGAYARIEKEGVVQEGALVHLL